jgi:hypothetical protein
VNPIPSLYDFFPWLRPLPAAVPARAPASAPGAEEREAVRRWEDEGGNVK